MTRLPTPPTPQAVSSSTFVSPAVDGSLTLGEIFDHNAKNSSHHPFFIYEDESTHAITTVTWRSLVRATHQVSKVIKSSGIPSSSSSSSPRVIAILALIDTISYFTLIHGIMRAGYIPFPISPRNSPAAIAHLVSKTGVTHMFVSEDPSMQALSAGSLKVLATQGGQAVQRVTAPFFDELYLPYSDDDNSVPPAVEKLPIESVALILHSSGSTSHPKPIPITQRILIEWARIPHYGEVDFCDEVIGAVSLPMFHALGVINSTSMTACGATLAVFQPVRQPAFPTPERVMQSLPTLGINVLFALPIFLEAWSQNPNHVENLKKCRAVIFSGGPLSKIVGDALAADGVRLMQVFGITEVGCTNLYIPRDVRPEHWEYFTFSKAYRPVLVPQDDEKSGPFELQLLPCETHTPAVLNCTIDGQEAYNTNDLVVAHPVKEGYYKVFGRADDQIMLSTGEKTNPGPLEAIISKDPLIAGCVIFGRGRTHNGVIILPAPSVLAAGLDVSDPGKVGEYIDLIWPSIKLANAYAPSHSRLFREMIVLANPAKPFTFTGKGSIRKTAVMAEYSDEIEAAYAAAEAGGSSGTVTPSSWTRSSTVDFITSVIRKVMETHVGDDDDIFQHGADSLQATIIRNTVVKVLQADGFDTSAIPSNLVYEYPTINKLGHAIYSTIDPASSNSTLSDKRSRATQLEALVDKYTSNFPIHIPSLPAPNTEVILLTGSTGALGSTILSQLITMPSVSKIYALNRKAEGKTLKQRQVQALIDRGYDTAVANSKKLVLIETDPKSNIFGVGSKPYEEIRTSVTTIIHCSWKVDFNLSLPTFEPLIHGVRELVDLSLSSPFPSPPRLLFASSISIFGDWHSSTPALEAFIQDSTVAVGNGYGESKWVSEMILQRAAEETPLSPTIVRIGQLAGGKNGSWNTSEWVPALVRSGLIVGALPSCDEEVSWLPLDTAASGIVDFRQSAPLIVHLAHPQPTTWNSIFIPISKSLGVPLVSYQDWLQRLEADMKDPSRNEVEAARRNPALLLIEMFRSSVGGNIKGREAMGLPRLRTENAVKASAALCQATLKPLGEDDALRWVSYWRQVGFLGSTQDTPRTRSPASTSTTTKSHFTPPQTPDNLSSQNLASGRAALFKVAFAVVCLTYLISLF